MPAKKRSQSAKRSSARIRTGRAELSVKLSAFGPTADEIAALRERVATHRTVQKYLAKTRFRLLHLDILDEEPDEKRERPREPERYRATFYDYTNERAVIAIGKLRGSGAPEVELSSQQPLPSPEEFQDAARIALGDRQLADSVREHGLRAYEPMPPLISDELPDGRTRRVLAVGLMPREGMRGHEIVGVSMAEGTVTRFEPSARGRAPETSAAHNPICGRPNAGQATQSSGGGSAWVRVTQGGTTLWRFLVVRPSGSSGTNGSGVELRYVDYKGKRLLYRAHVPILNVKYDANACGPYRDWQNQEGMIQASGTDPVLGFRLCTAPATTILDTGSDTGNFLGVAIYVQGQEVVLVSEMQAGWYRYISMWRLHTNGTIKPRFGFSAVSSSCVCNIHHHHAYWRLDFDVRTAGNNIVREFNDPKLVGNSNWHDKVFEIRRPRDPARKRKWRVENKSTKEAYDIIPGGSDGVATASPDWPFPKGDVWILRYHAGEIDDGVPAVGPPFEAGMDAWLTGESIDGRDVVIWYGAHFTHDVQGEEPGHFGHIVGPDLKLVRW
jgi:hypothetical protein